MYSQPSASRMADRHEPPGRGSASANRSVKSFGQYQRIRWAGSVHARQTSSRGASNVRVIFSVNVGSVSWVIGLLLALEFLEVFIQPIKPRFPELAVLLNP